MQKIDLHNYELEIYLYHVLLCFSRISGLYKIRMYNILYKIIYGYI